MSGLSKKLIGETFDRTDATSLSYLPNGDYVVAWMTKSASSRVIAFQRFSSEGSALTSVLYVPQPESSQFLDSPSVFALPNGGYAIGSYIDAGSTRNFSYAVYSSDNRLLNDRLYFGEPGWSYGHDNLAYANGYVLSVSHSEAGGTGGQSGEGAWDVNVFLRSVSDGSVAKFKAATNNFGAQINAEVIPLSDGTSFLIVWADKSGALDSSEYGVYGRIFSTVSKSFSSNPFLINQNVAGSQGGWNGEIAAVSLPDDKVAVFWINDVNAGVYRATIDNGQIKGRSFSVKDGVPTSFSAEFSAAGVYTANQNFVSASSTSDGNIIIAFSSARDFNNYDIIAKVLGPDGGVVTDEFVVSNEGDRYSKPDVSVLPNGSAVVVWTKENAGTSALDDRQLYSSTISNSIISPNRPPVIEIPVSSENGIGSAGDNISDIIVPVTVSFSGNITPGIKGVIYFQYAYRGDQPEIYKATYVERQNPDFTNWDSWNLGRDITSHVSLSGSANSNTIVVSPSANLASAPIQIAVNGNIYPWMGVAVEIGVNGPLLTISENTTYVTTVRATDPDVGDSLTYSIAGGADSSLFQISASTGILSFRAAPNFEAPTDSGRNNVYDVIVGVSDGSLTDTHVIAVTVTNANEAPIFSFASQSITATAGAAKTISLSALDVDGDALTYTVATPGKGSASISGSTLTYTPASTSLGADSFIVTASDGKGGTATQTINATISAALAPKAFTIYTKTGWVGSVGGNGTVLGTNGFEDVSVLYGQVSLDGSFSRGTDILRVPGDGGDFMIGRSNASTAFLEAGNAVRISVPMGSLGLGVVFTDGVRKLVYSGGYKIGGQSFTAEGTQITAAADGTSLPSGADTSAQASVFLNSAGLSGGSAPDITLSGKARILGTNGIDVIKLADAGADLVFDGSFGRGGDIIILTKAAADYQAARLNASTLVLTSDDERLTIPVGTKGLTLRFADEDRVLIYKSGALHIGDQPFSSATATALTPSTISLSIDQGTPNDAVTLDGAGKVIFTDNAGQTTNVILANFGKDDLIRVTGATALQYNFTLSSQDPRDLEITYTDPVTSASNLIVLDNVIANDTFVADYETAAQAVGWNFMAFG